MTRHFLWLVLTGARNRVRRQLRRLRNPRYAIALVLGVAYFAFIFGGFQDPGSRGEVGDMTLTAARLIGPLFLTIITAWWWLWGGHRSGILLTPAEAHLLLPAPLSRREIIRYKIMNAQAGILFSALMGSLLARGSGVSFPLLFLSLWTMIATLHMHQIAASLVHAAAGEQGRSGVRRQLVPLLLFGAALITMLFAITRAVAQIRAASGIDDAMSRLVAVLSEPGPRIVLAPFRLLLAPTVAPTLAEWVPAFGGALLLLVLHYIWVQRTDAAFEEVAAEEGAKQATREAAVRTGGLTRLHFTSTDRPKTLARPWLPIPPAGRPAYAIVWKNALLAQRSARLLTILLPMVGLMLVMLLVSDEGSLVERGGELGFGLLVFAGLITIAGPLAARFDLRLDLGYIDLLRTYPLPGRDLVTAGIATSTAAICLAQLTLAVPGVLLITFAGKLAPGYAVLAVIGLLIASPVINGLAVAIQNAIALLYPGWSKIGDSNAAGIEAVGQNLLVLIGTLVFIALSLLPALIVGGVVGGVLSLSLGPWAIAPGALAAVAVIAGEVVLGVIWLGRLYDSTDPVEAGLLMR